MNEGCYEDIRLALRNILMDGNFLPSPLLSAFLGYVVEETINGRSDRIKAYNIAVDALGKAVTFDPQADPAVRVLAHRLRRKLKQYHCENTNLKVLIEMSAGSYVPKFYYCRNTLVEL